MSEQTGSIRQDIRKARRQGMPALEERQRKRLADMVAHARANSPCYRELYKDLPERIEDPTLLPVTDKKMLMGNFDDWVTDRAVAFEEVRAFVDDPERIGHRFHDKYLVGTTSGTSGHMGIFLLDERNMTVSNTLLANAMFSWLGLGGMLRALFKGGRLALIIATGGHHVAYAGYAMTVRESWWRRKTTRTFSVHMPISELVDGLNEYRPAILLGYTSVLMMLTAEKEAGRLEIDPLLIMPAAETLTESDAERLSKVFNAKVRNMYNATECTFLSHSCAHGWYHVNIDWVTLEPVDADHRPVPPGEMSHTVLISNLANRVQPFLRYDLGDSVMLRPDPCPCGNPLPAIRVQGRTGDILSMPGERGDDVSLSPLAFNTLFDRTPGIEVAQVEQTEPTTLRVRMHPSPEAEPERVWQDVRGELGQMLADNGLDNVRLERADEPPRQEEGGKHRTVIPL